MGRTPDTRPAIQAPNPADIPIGLEGILSMSVETNIFIIGKTREELAGMTPRSIEDLADAIVDNSPNFVGS